MSEDIYNVIDPTLNLDTLDKEMLKWSLQPHEIRMRSDEECIRKYGVTNTDLYNNLKASILDPQDPEKSKVLESVGFVPEDITAPNEDIERNTAISMDLNTNPNIAIIDPNSVKTLEELRTIYTKYMLTLDKYKRFSNYYSEMLFGYNVPNMYNIVLSKLQTQQAEKNENDPVLEFALTNLSKPEADTQAIRNDLTRAIIENDILAIEYYNDNFTLQKFSIAEKESIMHIMQEIDSNTFLNIFLSREDCSEFGAVPWFTVDERPDVLEFFEDKEYSSKLAEAGRLFKIKPSEDNRNRLLELGWNPEVPVNMESVAYARQRQATYINSHKAKIVDCTNLVGINPVNESSTIMRKLYKDHDLYPVYIVLSFTNTRFGKIIRFVKHSTFSHAGLTLDSNLRTILTFKYDSNYNGFNFESLKTYTDTYDQAQIEVLCLFVDGITLKKLKAAIQYYVDRQEDTKYGFKNLFYILFKKKKHVDDYSLELVCSQFVDHILKLCGIDIIKKPNNLVIPQDYATIAVDHPRVYKLYEGLAKEYNERKIENIIEILFNNYKEIKYVNERTGLEYTLDEEFYNCYLSVTPSIKSIPKE